MNKPMTATETLKRNKEYFDNPPIDSEVYRVKQFIEKRQKAIFTPLINRILELRRA